MLLLNSLLGTTLQQPPFFSTDGTAYRSEWAALLHDLVEAKWQRLLPTLQDGKAVRKTRLDLCMSQSELAKEARISQQMLAKVENGQRRISERIAHRLWSAMWRAHEERKKTPAGIEMLVRLDRDMDTAIVTQVERVSFAARRT